MSNKSKLPTPQQLMVLARSLAYRMAYDREDIDDLIQEALWVVHRDFQHVRQPRDPFAFARTCMYRAIADYNRKQKRYRQHNHVTELNDNYYHHDTKREEERLINNLQIEQFLTTLTNVHGQQAYRIAINLMVPKDPKFEHDMIKGAQGGKQQVRARLALEQIRRALALSPTEWQTKINEVRTFTHAWLLMTADMTTNNRKNGRRSAVGRESKKTTEVVCAPAQARPV